MSPNDIIYYHSGGAANNDPTLDLGGLVSVFQLSSSSLNNLFDDLNGQTSRNGITDYRCFYIFNTNADETLKDAQLWLEYDKPSGYHIEIGVERVDEIQTVNFSGTPSENDNVIINVDGSQITVVYDKNTTIWQGNFQTEIRSIDGMEDVIVNVAGEIPNVTFTVKFIDSAGSRNIPLMSTVTSNMQNTAINYSEVQAGSPVGTTAPTIPTKLHTPSGVDFQLYLRGNPIPLGDLKAGDGFPIWIKRITPPNTTKKTLDQFILNIRGGGA